MNYRHIYHAGNFADVFKHWILTLILAKLHDKPTPFCMLDTHASLGMYDLEHPHAQKTLEFTSGVAQLYGKNLAEPFSAYMRIISAYKQNHGVYPGSAAIMREFLRDNDRLLLNELHPEDYATLCENFGNDKQIKISQQDAYVALKSLLPPKERRGVILIDPPFEIENDEFALVVTGLGEALKRFATGIYVVWYPIKARHDLNKFYRSLAKLKPPTTLCVELHAQVSAASQLNGCGMIIVNPPWKLDQVLKRNLPKLVEYLQLQNASWKVEELQHKMASK